MKTETTPPRTAILWRGCCRCCSYARTTTTKMKQTPSVVAEAGRGATTRSASAARPSLPVLDAAALWGRTMNCCCAMTGAALAAEKRYCAAHTMTCRVAVGQRELALAISAGAPPAREFSVASVLQRPKRRGALLSLPLRRPVPPLRRPLSWPLSSCSSSLVLLPTTVPFSAWRTGSPPPFVKR
jgi:hypothetical protein